MSETVTYTFSYEMELTPLEAGIRLEDFHPNSPWRQHFIDFGLGPVVSWARQKDGKDVATPAMDYLTKGARRRAWEKDRTGNTLPAHGV